MNTKLLLILIYFTIFQGFSYAQDHARPPIEIPDQTGSQAILTKNMPSEESPVRKDEHTIRQAVSLARQGQTEKALSLLEPIVKRRPEDKKLLRDYVVILGWANKDREALAMAPKVGLENAPFYVIDSLAKSARNLHLFDRSVELYRLSILMSPERLQGHIGLVLALSDAGKSPEALESLTPLLKKYKNNPDLLFTKAYAHEAGGEKLQALWIYEKILRRYPGKKEALRLKILALSSLGAPGLALSMAMQHPGLLTDRGMERIQGDWAAIKVKWGKLSTPPGMERFSETDEAIEILEENIQRLRRESEKKDLSSAVLRARFDRIAALHSRVRMEEVIDEYESLSRQGILLPQYVLESAGDAYLYLEQPEKAVVLYRKVLATSQDKFLIHLSLFWAYIESGDFDRANELIGKLIKEQKTWRISRMEGARPVYGKNERRLIAESTAALALAFSDNLPEAQRRLEDLLNAAPFNHDLRQRLGHIYLWRGWPRRAQEEFDHILPVEPELLDARLGKASSLMDLRDYEEAERLMTDLYGHFPEKKQAQRLKKDWGLYNKKILTTEVGFGSSSATDQDSDSFRFDTYLYSSPQEYHYRVFLHSFYEKAEIRKEDVSNQREGFGIQYGGPEITGEVEVHNNKESNHDIDISGGISWEADDHWKVGASMDTFSLDAPLQGILQDIRAWSADLDLLYRADESANTRMHLQRLDFSDDNLRLSGLLSVQRRLLSRPYLKIPVSVELYGSRNSRKNRPYFNPESDLSGSLTVDFQWLMWRRYARSFAQNLSFSGGFYRQKNFGTRSIRSLRYEHDWNISEEIALLYGVSWSRRVFDGDPENGIWSYLTFTWRF